MNNRRLLLIAIPVVALLVAVGLVIANGSSSSTPGTGTTGGATTGGTTPAASGLQNVAEVTAELTGIPETAGVLGFPDAPVTVTEYGDLRCPVCRQFDLQVMPDVVSQLVATHRIKIAFRHWLIIQTDSPITGQSAYAAMQQDHLWAYALVTYANQGDETTGWFDAAFSDAAATAVGMDVKAFDAARDSPAAAAYVAEVDKDASARGFQGTPTIVVKGPKGEVTLDSIPDLAAITSSALSVGGK
jgi:protein-disulfide isomerase